LFKDFAKYRTLATGNLAHTLAHASAGEAIPITFSHDFGNVVVQGELDISGTIDVDLQMSGTRIKEFEVDFTTSKSVSVTVKNEKAISGSLSYDLPPINLPPLQFDAVFLLPLRQS
jgi:hypothetical protein